MLKIVMQYLKHNLPEKTQVLAVLGTIMFVVFGYGFLRLYWYLPSWMGYLNILEILVIVAYMLSLAFIESLLLLIPLLLFAMMIPRRIFSNRFASVGFLIVLITTILALFVHEKVGSFPIDISLREIIQTGLIYLAAYLLFVIALVYLLVYRIKSTERFLDGVSDRMVIFTYLYVPLSAIGLITIFIRSVIR